MKVREIIIFSGEQFTVPQCIQRIDSKATHGWQVRYHGTKMFSDHTPDGSGASQALAKATRELLNRIAALPAPVSLQKSPSANKTSNLPSGISGPILRKRKRSNVRTASLSVLLPQHGEPPKCKSIYIGSEGTYTLARFKQAVARAVELRAVAEEEYELAATRAKRKAGSAMRAAIRRSAAAR
jgi:hypothetical protein